MASLVDQLESRAEEILIMKGKLSKKEAQLASKSFCLLISLFGKGILKFSDLAKEKQTPLSTIIHTLAVCCKCSLSEEEGQPISTSFITSNYHEINNILPDSFEHSIPNDIHISNWREIRNYCKYVDGETSLFIVNKDTGMIEGAKNIQRYRETYFLSYSSITQQIINSIAFLVIKGRKCFRIYSNGILLHHIMLIRKYGVWTIRDLSSQLETLISVSSKKGINSEAINTFFRTSIRISELGLGAAFFIGDKQDIISHISTEKILDTPQNYAEMTDEQIIRNVTSDGAALVSKSGDLVSVETKFIATGGRRASMIDITKIAHHSIGLVISQDGSIYLIEKGTIITEF